MAAMVRKKGAKPRGAPVKAQLERLSLGDSEQLVLLLSRSFSCPLVLLPPAIQVLNTESVCLR